MVRAGSGPGRGGRFEDAGVDEALLGGVPAVRGGGDREGGEFGADLDAVARCGENPDLLGERFRVRAQVVRLAVGQVAHIDVLTAVEGNDVLELTEHAEGAASGLASAN